MRNRVIELVAIVAIQVALLGYIQMRSPWLVVEDSKDLLETDHWFLIVVTETA